MIWWFNLNLSPGDGRTKISICLPTTALVSCFRRITYNKVAGQVSKKKCRWCLIILLSNSNQRFLRFIFSLLFSSYSIASIHMLSWVLNSLSLFALWWVSFIKGFPYLSRAQIHIHGIWMGKVFGENANIRLFDQWF